MSYCGISHFCCSKGVASESDRRSSPILRRGVRRRQHSVSCHAGVRCEKKVGPHHQAIRHQQVHSLIRGVLIQSCSARAKNFTNYVFFHPQFSGVIQNIEKRCAIKANLKKKIYSIKLIILLIIYIDKQGSK